MKKDIFINNLKKSSVILTAALVISGFFVANFALAVEGATITPASGGINISIDTTSAEGGSRTFKSLNGPSITESNPGNIVAGTHTIFLPLDWEFDTTSVIGIYIGGDIVLDSTSITPGETSFSFTVNDISISSTVLGFSGLKVRPTGTIPSTSNMTYFGVGINGVNETINFGTLSTIAGTVTQLAFYTQPGDAVYGSILNPQPGVETQDQFGNHSTSGLATNLDVTLTLSGTGALHGDNILDIGINGGDGVVTFTDLKVDQVGEGKQLIAEADDLVADTSEPFNIIPKPLTATVTVNDKDYDDTDEAIITGIILDGIVEWDRIEDNVEVDLAGAIATFADENVGTYDISITGVVLTGDDTFNYTLANEDIAGTATINPLGITITPDANQTKVYGEDDPTLTYAFDPALIGDDVFTDALSREEGKNVGNYAYTLGTLSAGPNYELILDLEADTFEITQRLLTVTATGIDKIYDATTDATVTLSDDRVSGDILTTAYTAAVFTDNKDIGESKPIEVSGISISGTDSGNYTLANNTATISANVTAKGLTVDNSIVTSKTYDGTTTAVITGATLVGVIGSDTVDIATHESGTFDTKNVGTGKSVVTVMTITGADASNYTVTQPTVTGSITTKAITLTAIANEKVYDGETTAAALPTLTGELISGDVGIYAETYDDQNVGTTKTLTPEVVSIVDDGSNNMTGNYTVTLTPATLGTITTKAVNVTAQTDTRVYDGTTTSTVVPVGDSLIEGDTWWNLGTQVFSQTNIGTNLTITASEASITDGNSGNNYVITYVTNTTGEITAKNLTVTGAVTVGKIYDGNTTATIDFTSARLVGVIDSEDVTLSPTGYSAIFDSKNVGTEKTVTVSGIVLTDTGKSNYSLTQPTLNDGVITQRTLVVTATGVNKVYDADTTATATLLDDRVSENDITLGYTATFADKNVGDNKPVSVSVISITGGVDVGNYTLGNTTDNTTANITPALLTATVTVEDKVYNGDNSAIITGVTLNGILLTDNVTVNSQGIATFINSEIGDDKDVSATDVTITGADVGNYSFDNTATGIGNIFPIPMMVYVDDDFSSEEEDAGGHTFGYDAFATIQEGIDAVDEYGTVNVAAGTYNESLLLKESLTLNGTGEKPVITGDSSVNNYIVKIDGTFNVTISNLEINGGGSGTGDNVFDYGLLVNDSDEVDVYNCTIENVWKTSSNGIGVEGSTNVDVYDSVISSFHKRGIRYINSDGIFYGNEIIGDNVDGTSRVQNLVNLWGGSNVEIYENVLHNALTEPEVTPIWDSPGIFVSSYGGDGVSYANIHDNEIYNCDSGIVVGSVYADADTDESTAEITDNNLHNLKWAINFEVDTVSATIAGNSFTNNEIAVNAEGFEPIAGPVVNAEGNWWGAAVPDFSTIVYDNVNYDPWYLDKEMETLSSEVGLENIYVDDDYTVENCDHYFGFNAFATIQEGIDAVDEGRTIDVAAGSYTENLNANKSLSLVGPNSEISPNTGERGSEAIISGEITVAANNITINGFTITNPSGKHGIYAADRSGLTVANNIVNNIENSDGSTSGTNFGIAVVSSAAALDNITITDNQISQIVGGNNKSANGIAIGWSTGVADITNLLIQRNKIFNITSDTSDYAAGGRGAYGILINHGTGLTGKTVDPQILDNEISNLEGLWAHAIGLEGNTPNAIVSGNTISNLIDHKDPSDAVAIQVEDNDSADTVTISQNKLLNTNLGIQNVVAEKTVNAERNWWGTIDRTIITSKISGSVNYRPWCTEDTCTVEDYNIPTVVSHVPTVNAMNVEPANDIMVTFSEAVTVEIGNVIFDPAFTDFSVQNSGTDVVSISPNNPLKSNTSYTITLSGVTDLAGNVMVIYDDINFTTATFYHIPLYSVANGWNLISLPVVPNEDDISDVLGDAENNINSVWTYDPGHSNADPDTGWLTYTPDNPTGTNNLDVMTTGYGYWISTINNTSIEGWGSLLTAGPTVPPSRTLSSGWNLIGYYQIPGEDSSAFEEAFSSLGDSYTGLWGYDNEGGVFKSTVDPILPGDAFWISLPSETMYTPSNIGSN